MAVADRFKAAADYGRRAAAAVGQRPTTVSVVTETYSGNYGADGATLLDTDTTVLDPSPKVEVTAWEPSAFGGGGTGGRGVSITAAEVRVGPVTPDFPGGGYAGATLDPPPSDATQRVYLVLAGGMFDAAGERFEVNRLERPTPQSTFVIAQRSHQV